MRPCCLGVRCGRRFSLNNREFDFKIPWSIGPIGARSGPHVGLFQKEQLGDFLYAAGEPEKIGEGGKGKNLGGGENHSAEKQTRKPQLKLR